MTMDVDPGSLRHILGLKLRRFRQKKALGLKEMAARTGMSISYLSEIEKGRKYPKPEKLLALARALDVPFDELVSLKVDEELGPVKDLLRSSFMREFPFHLFGLEMERLLGLVTSAPSRAGALLRTALEIGHTYDAQVEHFLFAALRSYQHMHQNYYEDIEASAAAFSEELGLDPRETGDERGQITAQPLKAALEQKHGFTVTDVSFDRHSELRGLRSVYVEGRKPRLMINNRLLPSQKRFQLARELGYQRLELKARSATSSPIRVESFDQVINDFTAAYFAGALMIQRDPLVADCEKLFRSREWSADDFLTFLNRYRTTPETFFYRLSQLLPRFFGLKELFFLRFSHQGSAERYMLSKILNMSQLPIFHGLEPDEHYCRRWGGIRLLGQLADRRASAGSSDSQRQGDAAEEITRDWMATAQRATFVADDTEFFVITLARPLVLSAGADTSVSLGLLMDRGFKRRVRFWNDPKVPQVEVGLTCERCSLSADECTRRAAPPRQYQAAERRRLREEQLAQMIAESDPAADSEPGSI